MSAEWTEIEFVPTVKAYPALSRKYGEVCCVAGVQLHPDGSTEWIRLYPVPFRALDDERQFRKYEPIRVRVQSHSGDTRPETRRPDIDSIKPSGRVVSAADGWRARRPLVEPLMSSSMCELVREERQSRRSLGVFRPAEVLALEIQAVDQAPDRAEIAAASAAQGSLLSENEVAVLKATPFVFKYRYRCSDPACRTHTQTIIDWEIAAFYRKVRNSPDWEGGMRRKWVDELCAPDRDTAFIVGNMHQHPQSFLVLGVWWPPLEPEQLRIS